MSNRLKQMHVIKAIRNFLEYGNDSLDKLGGHKGYYSKGGWAYERMREHVEELEAQEDIVDV
jgi:hypothetical protein